MEISSNFYHTSIYVPNLIKVYCLRNYAKRKYIQHFPIMEKLRLTTTQEVGGDVVGNSFFSSEAAL